MSLKRPSEKVDKLQRKAGKMEEKAGTSFKMLSLRLLRCSSECNNLKCPQIIYHLTIHRGLDSAKNQISICIYKGDKPLKL